MIHWEEIFAIRIPHGYILQIFLAEMLFFPILKKRSHFWLRFSFGFILYCLLSVIATNIISMFISGIVSLTIFLLTICLNFFCFKNRAKEILFCCISAQLIQNLSYNIECVIRLPIADKMNDIQWFFLSVGVMLIIYFLFYFFIVRRLNNQSINAIDNTTVLPLAIISASFCYFIHFLFQIYEIDNMWITRLPFILCSILILFVQYGLLIYKRKIEENLKLESFILQGNKQYETLKSSIDIINMKAHDLKHFASNLQQGEDKDKKEAIEEITSSVDRYEQLANTGNSVLDVILTEKMYICHNNNINFSFMAEGEALSFMHSNDIAIIFQNAISNAIEYEMTIQNPDKRYIILRLTQKEQIVAAHIENYCVDKLTFEDNLPVTTKGSKDYHGFGLKSIRYTVKKYNGNVTISNKNERFCLDIIFPVPVKQ